MLDKEKEEMKNRSLGHDWHSHTPTIFSTYLPRARDFVLYHVNIDFVFFSFAESGNVQI